MEEQSFGWSLGWLVDRSVGQLVSQLVSLLVSKLVSWLVLPISNILTTYNANMINCKITDTN